MLNLHDHGRLSALDEARLVLTALYARFLAGRPCSRLEAASLAAVPMPTGPLARAAEKACAAVTPSWLDGHLRRTHALASLFAHHDGLTHDAELLYAAALLHDLALTLRYASPDETCFAVHGAQLAYELARRAGEEESRARRLKEAIALHLEVRVAVSQGIEAHLLHAGAACDVLGARLAQLDPALRGRLLDAHPRDEFEARMAETMRAEAQRAPRTRMGLYCRHFHFAERVERSPWSREQP